MPAFTSTWTLKRAREVGGKITVDNSKMPGTTFALDAKQCRLGTVLAKIKGSVCEDCNMIGLQKRRNKVNNRYEINQRATEETVSTLGLEIYGEAHAYQILHYGFAEHRWLASGDLASPEMLDGICHAAKLTPDVRHWVATREKALVLAWYADRGHTLPDNVTIRLSAAMVNGEPNKALPAGIVTSTVHRGKDREPLPFDCPALPQGDMCLDCRHCWDRDVPNVSYQFHNYGTTAKADMPEKVWFAMNQSRKEKGYGDRKWLLLPPKMEVPYEELLGEEAALTHPIFDLAFEESLKHYEQNSNIAMLTLCAASNDNSPKLKVFEKEFTKVDLVIFSNTTVTSYDLWRSCWPYRSYDALRKNNKWDDLYIEKGYERIIKLFNAKTYDYVIANFVPTKTRNLVACRRALSELKEQGRIKDFAILPQWHTYDDMRERLGGSTRFPDIEPEVLAALHEYVDKWTT